PLNPVLLRNTVEKALALDRRIVSASLRSLVSRIRAFPTIPSLYLKVLTALKAPDVTIEEVSGIITQDMGITTKLLQMTNSAAFGLSREITDLVEAIGILGFETVTSMVLAIKLLNEYDQPKPVYF